MGCVQGHKTVAATRHNIRKSNLGSGKLEVQCFGVHLGPLPIPHGSTQAYCAPQVLAAEIPILRTLAT